MPFRMTCEDCGKSWDGFKRESRCRTCYSASVSNTTVNDAPAPVNAPLRSSVAVPQASKPSIEIPKTEVPEERPALFDQNPTWWPVNMLDHEIPVIEKEAKAQADKAVKEGWNEKVRAGNLRDKTMGVAGEYVVALMVNLPRTSQTLLRGSGYSGRCPDVGDFIEVRTAPDQDMSRWNIGCIEDLIIDDRAYFSVLGFLYPKWMVIQGWVWGHEFRTKGKPKPVGHLPDRRVLFVDRSDLREPMSIFDIIRARPKPTLAPSAARDWTPPPKKWQPPPSSAPIEI